MDIKIKNHEIVSDIVGESEQFPKYTTQIMNLANQNAQGTRPKVVGQMSDLIQECPGRSLEEWVEWYQDKMPDAIDNATDKVYEMLKNLKEAMDVIDRDLVKKWIKDLLLTKTYVGLRFQESLLKKVSSLKEEPYRLATPSEEKKGIDGYIGDVPISIKPKTYKIKNALQEIIDVKVIYYEKLKDGIRINFEL